MKNALFLGLALLASLLVKPAQAFLASGDPDNFFALLESASIVAVVKLDSFEAPASKRPFFLYELKKSSLLRGDSKEDKFKVAEEVLLVNSKPLFREKQETLVFLAPIPDFTAYRELRSRGYGWRVFGGKRGVWPAETSTALAQAYLAASGAERNSLLLKVVIAGPAFLVRDAVLLLAQRGPLPLSSEDAEALARAASGSVDADLANAAVRILDQANNESARQALLKLAAAPGGPGKWAAIRTLEKKGQGRSVAQLAEDYQGADAAGRSQALNLIAAKQDAEALAFFSGLLAGPADFQAKRDAIQSLGQRKNPAYERLLIKQIGGAEESVQAEAILALGKMNSAEAVPIVLPLLDSSSEKLRGAAFFMLMDSPDPRAQAVISQRYERDHHGGWTQNPHFHGNPQPLR